MNLRELCDPVTTRIALATGDTVFLNVRSGFDVLCIDRKEGTFPIKTLIFEIGSRRPLGIGAGGIALLMQLSDEDLAEVLAVNRSRFQAYGKLSARSVLALVRRSKELGYVVTQDIVVRDVSAISLPFGGHDGVPAAAISVACVPSRMPQSRHRELVAFLRAEIKSLENNMNPGKQLARRVA